MAKKPALLILYLSFCLCVGCAINPITGEEELMFFPAEQDIAIGEKYAPEVEKQLGGRIDNPQLQNYVDYQLAAILGHEIAHVVARDSLNVMSNEIGISILLSAVASEHMPEGALVAADLAHQILGLSYSRKDERQADLGGLDYMVRAGYNPYGMVEIIQMLQDQQKERPIEFFSTHPSPQNRIGYITEGIQTKYYGFAGLKIGKEDYRTAVLEQLNNN